MRRGGSGAGCERRTAAVAIIAGGATLRALASRGDLWLDEIWSLALVRRAGNALAVLSIAHDNSHPLNSLYLYVVGDARSAIVYRLLALASGIVAIVMALRIGARQGTRAALLTGGAVAISFPMVVYSSEARGYMPAIAAAFCAFVLAQDLLATPRWRTRVAFWVTSVAGLLSHYVFIQVLVGIAAWSAYGTLRRSTSRRAALVEMLWMHLVPLGSLGALYWTVLSRLRIGGGPRLSGDVILGDTLGWTLGLPTSWLGLGCATLLVALVLIVELGHMRRSGDDAWIFHLVVVLVLPLVVVAVHPPLLYPRYFLPMSAFLLVLLASFVARVQRRRGIAALLGVAIAATFCAGNAIRLGSFLRDGRGDYRSALVWMAAQSAGSTLTVTSSNDFAVRNEIEFHGRTRPDGKTILYLPIRLTPRTGADWLVVRREEHDPQPESVVEDPHGNRYVLRRRFPSYGPSGSEWIVFARS